MANHKHLPEPMNNAWMLPGTETWWSSVSEYQSEMFDFMSHRFSKDSVALHGLGECRNWDEVSDLYSSWAQPRITHEGHRYLHEVSLRRGTGETAPSLKRTGLCARTISCCSPPKTS